MARRLSLALVGAVASIALSFLPFSTVLGGGLAGFLQGSNPRDGALTGGLSGLVLLFPAALLVSIGAGVVVYVLGLIQAPGAGYLGVAVFFTVLFALVFCYTVVLSALGGLVGAWAASTYPNRHRRACRQLGVAPSSDRPRPKTGAVEEPSTGSERHP